MGVGARSFGSGFASGIAQMLAQRRQEDNLKKEREIQNNWRMFQVLANSDQVGGLENLQPFLDSVDLGFPTKKGKTGDPKEHFTNMFGHIMRSSSGKPLGRGESQGPLLGQVSPQANAQQQPDMSGVSQMLLKRPDGTIGQEPARVTTDAAGNESLDIVKEPLQSRPLSMPQAGQAPPQSRSFMGVPLLSQDEVVAQKLDREATQTLQRVKLVRERIFPALKEVDPAATLEDAFAVAGVRLPVDHQAAQVRPMSVSPGSTVIEPGTGRVLFQAPPKEPTPTPDRTVTVPPGSRVVRPSTGEVVYEAPDRPKDGTATDDAALAEMVAGNPTVLQGLTPTVAGSVMRGIAKDPALKARFEQVRMAPIKEKASAVLSTLDQLLDVDQSGKVTLKPGTQGLYGPGIGRLGRLIPGSAVNNAKAALDQITGELTLDALEAMKQQSRTGATGFGQLSTRELEVIQSAASTLKGEISEAKALQELTKLRERFAKILQPGAAEAAPVAGAAKAVKQGNKWMLPVPTP